MRSLVAPVTYGLSLVAGVISPEVPAAMAQPVPPTVTVLAVADGDTVNVRFADGTTGQVRLLGIDTPATQDLTQPPPCYGAEAAARSSELALGREAQLELDAEPYDPYGRWLGYLWLNDQNLSIQLAAEGYATGMIIRPNVKYADEIGAAVASAREQGLGLWGACGGPGTARTEYEAPLEAVPGGQWPADRGTAPPGAGTPAPSAGGQALP